tara:strand:+ start:155 stop:1258 length:1104 start_codon:yes stop_codon:yes gene_type:complete
MAKRVGRKSKAQTPAPKKDRIKGSKKNVKGSAGSKSSAKKIVFSDKLNTSIKNKVKEYNKANPKKKITTPTAKAVVRRGMGAFSKSYRPKISGGKPNSRQAWGLARLNAFMRKKSGSTTANGVVKSSPIKKVYTQDDDLFEIGGFVNTYDFVDYEYEDKKNKHEGVDYILSGEYTLVARALYKYDIGLWNYYRYIQRINITLEDCKRFALSLNKVFTEMVCDIPVYELKGKKRSYASFSVERINNTLVSNSAYYGKGKINGENFMINTFTKMVCCTKTFLEKTTGKPLPALDKNDYYNFLTLIHELAHCLDFQYQFKQGKFPVAAHKDYFLKALYDILKACRSGKLPIAKQFDNRAYLLQKTLTQSK